MTGYFKLFNIEEENRPPVIALLEYFYNINPFQYQSLFLKSLFCKTWIAKLHLLLADPKKLSNLTILQA